MKAGTKAGSKASFKKLQRDCAAFFKQIYVGEDRVLVFGEGGEDARVMLIGEAPGEQEALAGRPFVGKAGAKLEEFLASIDLPRESLYITNAVKFRPTRVSAAGRVINRAPTTEEIALWRPWLEREVTLLAPALLVTLGNVALRAVTGGSSHIGDVHGQVLPGTTPPVFALYHPASIIYRRALSETYQADLQKLKQVIRDI